MINSVSLIKDYHEFVNDKENKKMNLPSSLIDNSPLEDSDEVDYVNLWKLNKKDFKRIEKTFPGLNKIAIEKLNLNKCEIGDLKIYSFIKESSDYRIVYKDFRPVGENDVYQYKKENPYLHSVRNFYHYGNRVQLPSELEASFFAYGNSTLEESEIVFVGDSDHTIFH